MRRERILPGMVCVATLAVATGIGFGVGMVAGRAAPEDGAALAERPAVGPDSAPAPPLPAAAVIATLPRDGLPGFDVRLLHALESVASNHDIKLSIIAARCLPHGIACEAARRAGLDPPPNVRFRE